jgi:curved DNA-binding protein CbpA
MDFPNYYEFLQISPNAEPETIHRVFRFLAARLHPDNPETGDKDKFFELTEAFNVLSDPAQRAKYDAAFATATPHSDPLSASIDFMDGMDGELNRRLAVLAVLYSRRRTNSARPDVSLMEIEEQMGFPRDYLEFTMWYIQQKGYITRADNSAFTLTAEGVDFVEKQRNEAPVLNRLLTSSTMPVTAGTAETKIHPRPARTQAVVTPPPSAPLVEERRVRGNDRRSDQIDWRRHPVDRRVNTKDRRSK